MADSNDKLKRVPAHQIQEVAKALAGDLRLRILEALGERPKSISQLVEELGVAQPTVSINVQTLEQAGLLTSSQGSGREKICARTLDALLFELPMRPGEGLHQVEELSMPVGLYTDCSIQPPCGLHGLEGRQIGCPDDPRAFYMPERVQAGMLWFSGHGYVEYTFANPLPQGLPLQQLTLSAELCSEAEGYSQEWPSDITASINGCVIGTWTCPGDFGDRKGKLISTIPLGNSQYGLLTEWSGSEEGSRVNGEQAAETVLSDLKLHYNSPIKIRLEVRKDAGNCRGLNLFGAGYGDYPQDVKLRFVRKAEAD